MLVEHTYTNIMLDKHTNKTCFCKHTSRPHHTHKHAHMHSTENVKWKTVHSHTGGPGSGESSGTGGGVRVEFDQQAVGAGHNHRGCYIGAVTSHHNLCAIGHHIFDLKQCNPHGVRQKEASMALDVKSILQHYRSFCRILQWQK